MFFPPPCRFPAFAVCVALLFLALPPGNVRGAGKKKRDPSIAIRFHAEISGFDPTFATKVRIGNPPRDLTVEKIPSLSERDIASFYPYRASDGTYSVVLRLDRHGAATLEAVSTDLHGRLLVAVVNGRVVASLLVDKTIKDGVIYIPSGLSEANIRAMGASFSIMGETEEDKENGKAPKPSPSTTSLPDGEADLPESTRR